MLACVRRKKFMDNSVIGIALRIFAGRKSLCAKNAVYHNQLSFVKTTIVVGVVFTPGHHSGAWMEQNF